MSQKSIQDILPLVEQPSRYLGFETNTVIKDPSQVELSIALAFPDLYEIGTSHFGLQILYDILNAKETIAAERVFTPALDLESALREEDLPLFTLETQRSVGDFDIVGFSLLYELNYTNILTMLELSNIPFMAKDRDDTHPLIIGGGPCTVNPEPVADLFDAMVVGDGEEATLQMAEAWLQWKEAGKDRSALLSAWAEIEGVYIPSFFTASFEDGLQRLSPKIAGKEKVLRAVLADMDGAPFPERPVVPFGRPVHDRLRLEVGRGCSRGCRFCQAGMIYRPVRERSVENLLEITERSLATTGYDDISLLSLSTGDYGCLSPLMESLMGRYESSHTAVSLPSVRAGRLTPELMTLIKKVRKTGFTIAPEAGTQRLRDVINKGITEDEIIDTVTNAFGLGWKVIKLYFMIGLPTETEEDLAGIVDLVMKLRDIKGPKGLRGNINVSVNTFIPKAHAPFQWAPQISVAESLDRVHWLKDRLRVKGIQFKYQDPRQSLLEGLWARGDRRLSDVLVAAYRKGCKFDGWTDHFDFRRWQAVLDEAGVDPEFYTTRERTLSEPLPWDHIDTRVSRKFLEKEWEFAMEGALTEDCRFGNCSGCGVCDFKRIAPKVFETAETDRTPQAAGGIVSQEFKKLRVAYVKEGRAKYFGHLEMVNIFVRALKRAGIPVKYSEGFHPMPKISFDDPLPLGMESLCEFFYLTVPMSVRPGEFVTRLNAHLPEELKTTECHLAPGKAGRIIPSAITYRVAMDGGFEEAPLEAFRNASEHTFTRTNKKGKVRTIDLKEVVSRIERFDDGALEMELKVAPGKSVRPQVVVRHIFSLPEEGVKGVAVVKMSVSR